jgi:hypothetical protein
MKSRVAALLLCCALLCGLLSAQTEDPSAVERTYPFSVEAVQKALQSIGGFGGGKLPVLDGFVAAGDLDRYDHPYFQYRVHLKAVDANTTLVSVEAKISALYANQDPSKPEYQVLPSNGRLESDLHDRLQQALRGISESPSVPVKNKDASPPRPQSQEVAMGKAAPAESSAQAQLDAVLAERQSVREKTASLQAQIDQMKASDHAPSGAANVGSVKRSGVGVMSRQNFGGPVLFRAQAEDEFEIVELASGWAQVRLGPGSTGYIQADELTLPPGMTEKPAESAAAKSPAQAAVPAPDLGFSVSREDVTVFSGDWARLKGKKVLFVYAQPRGLLSDMGNEDAKLGYAKRIFESRFRSVSQSKTDVEGVVVVFLGARGGVAAATLSDIRQWLEGGLPDAAFVNRCSLDPPTEFRSMRLN